mgnify:CR=1 FL=1
MGRGETARAYAGLSVRPLRSLRAERDAPLRAGEAENRDGRNHEAVRPEFRVQPRSGRCRPDRQYRSERRADRCGVAEPFPVGERDRLCDQEPQNPAFGR